MEPLHVHATSLEETRACAGALVRTLVEAEPQPHAVVVALEGDLGAGKTSFVQGLAQALGIEKHITSPSFLIMKSYPIQAGSFETLVHIDTYRLSEPQELHDLGFEDILTNPHALVVVEWANKVESLLPPETLWIAFSHGAQENERDITIRWYEKNPTH